MTQITAVNSLKIQWVAGVTVCRRELTRILRIWTQTLLPSVISITLYYVIFGTFIGSRLGTIHGISYMDFIVPGLILMATVTNSYANVSSSFFSTIFQKNIEEMLVSPMKSSTLLIGFISGGIVRGSLVGLIVSVVSFLFTGIHAQHPFFIAVVIGLTTCLFSLLGIINGVFARKFDDIAIVPTFVLTPLTYLGGVFYSIDLLPNFWKKLSMFNPILYLVNLLRYGFHGISDINVGVALITMVAVVALTWWIAIRSLQRLTSQK